MRLFEDVSSRVADPYLKRAVELALRGRGSTAPNPMVGCVVVADGVVAGEGFHPAAGEPHAEVFALAQAGDRARGSDVYVTLEPCAHHGRTPPCTDALIAAGVSRVVIGMADPTTQAGGGAERLSASGIDVVWANDCAPFRELNEGWLTRVATGRPLVVVKTALSLDGAPGLHPGERAAITGRDGGVVTGWLRQRCDAVMVGAATVIADDPSLTLRFPDGTAAEHQPLRVVLARSELPPPDIRVFSDRAAPTLVLRGRSRDEPESRPAVGDAQLQEYAGDLGVDGALEALGRHGVNEVLVEPGPRLLTALWEAHAIDYLVTVVAGGMAGSSSPRLFEGELDAAGSVLEHLMRPVEAGIVGDVAVTVWRPRAAGADS